MFKKAHSLSILPSCLNKLVLQRHQGFIADPELLQETARNSLFDLVYGFRGIKGLYLAIHSQEYKQAKDYEVHPLQETNSLFYVPWSVLQAC